MKNIFKTFWLAVAATSMVACNNPTPDPTPEPPVPIPTDNSMTYDGTRVEFKSVVVDAQSGPLLTIFASATAGITTVEGMKADKYVSFALPIEDANKVIDVKGSTDFIFENSTTLCPVVKSLVTGETAVVSAGTMKLTMADVAGGAFKAEFDFTVADGAKKFQGAISGTYTPAPVVKENIISYQAEEMAIKSIVFADRLHPAVMYITVSATPGISTYEDMVKTDGKGAFVNKPFTVMVGKADMNADIDVMKPGGNIFGIINNSGICADIPQFQNGMSSDSPVKSGTMKFTYDVVSGNVTVNIDLVAKKTDASLKCNVTAVYTPSPEPATNVMKLNGGDPQPIVSKYVEIDNIAGTKTFYFSPYNVLGSGVETSELYAKLMVNDVVADGNKQDITTLKAGDFEFIYYQYKATGLDPKVTIKPGALAGATGWFAVTEKGDGSLTVEYDIKIGNNTVYGQAQGDFDPYNYGSSIIEYNALFEETVTVIRSVIVDQRVDDGATTVIYLSGVKDMNEIEQMMADGKPTIIKIPTAQMDGTEIEFGNPIPCAIHKGNEFNSATENLGYGTVSAIIEEGKFSCTLDMAAPEAPSLTAIFDPSKKFTLFN